MKIIETLHVTKQYHMGDQVVNALDDVSVEVQRGEFIAIMGPSGSGKSTLLHLLGGLDTPTSGEVILAGQRLSCLSDDELTLVRRQKIGFIFQFYNLLPTLSAEENISLPLLLDGKPANQQHAWLNVLLTMVGLAGRREHRPNQLSGGQQQRVAIARAFINQPEIVLGDEPTGNLDSRTGTAILELLRRTCGELEATIVMVTHDPRAASYADRVIFLKDGKMVHMLQNNGNTGDGQPVLSVMSALE